MTKLSVLMLVLGVVPPWRKVMMQKPVVAVSFLWVMVLNLEVIGQ